jgi:RNA polymerase-binding transcription factor DksA
VARHETARELLVAEYSAARERLTQLEREFAGIVDASGAAGTDDEHDPEGATIAFERQHVAALASQAREHLAEIDAALAKLRAGRYGLCNDCGQPIGTDRLAARPAALTCVRCAAGG